jgi:hypothetical protein
MNYTTRRKAAAEAAAQAAAQAALVPPFRTLTEIEIAEALEGVLGMVLHLIDGDQDLLREVCRRVTIRPLPTRPPSQMAVHTWKEKDEVRPINEAGAEILVSGWVDALSRIAPLGAVQRVLGKLMETEAHGGNGGQDEAPAES